MSSIRFALLRHGVTDWNAEKRIQGRSDISLREETIKRYQALQLPLDWQQAPWLCSPLSRTQQTADALGIAPITVEPAWIEMDWGLWEGRKLPDLRVELGAAMQENEDRGWDFRPQQGESPRDVLERVRKFLGNTGLNTFGAVTHKGVIRSVYASARGWNMMGKMPDKLDWECLQVFGWSPDGGLKIEHLNVPLVSRCEVRL
jgi:probable phosphoglycerate mutase